MGKHYGDLVQVASPKLLDVLHASERDTKKPLCGETGDFVGGSDLLVERFANYRRSCKKCVARVLAATTLEGETK